jgi:hypothetical protein
VRARRDLEARKWTPRAGSVGGAENLRGVGPERSVGNVDRFEREGRNDERGPRGRVQGQERYPDRMERSIRSAVRRKTSGSRSKGPRTETEPGSQTNGYGGQGNAEGRHNAAEGRSVEARNGTCVACFENRGIKTKFFEYKLTLRIKHSLT